MTKGGGSLLGVEMMSILAKADKQIVRPGVRVDQCGLRIARTLDYDEWKELGSALWQHRQWTAWAIGDWINAGQQFFGEECWQAVDAAKYSERSLRRFSYISQRFEFGKRWPELSFNHHEVVASLTPAAARKLLKRAKDERWSVSEFTAHIGGNVHFSTGDSEHQTPKHIVDAVRRCLRGVDLDPCSNQGKPNVPAKHYYTEKEDGLLQDWSGKVYMNPPYGRQIIEWVDKLVSSYKSGDVKSSVALVPARTDTEWFSLLAPYRGCFIRGRLAFSESESAAPFPSVVFYLGKDKKRFDAVFSKHGDIWQRVVAKK